MVQARKRGSQKATASAKALDDDDDLIGSAEPAEEEVSLRVEDVWGGVSAHWLAQVFGHDKMTIKKKLSEGGCQIVGRRNGSPTYNIAEAAQHLVKPKGDLAKHIERMRPQDLPPILHAAFWDGKLKRQKWEENAGGLWRTEDVSAVLGDLAVMIKTSVTLWVEDIDRAKGLTQDQRQMLVEQSDQLLTDIHKLMIEAPQRSRTPSSAESDEEVQEAYQDASNAI